MRIGTFLIPVVAAALGCRGKADDTAAGGAIAAAPAHAVFPAAHHLDADGLLALAGFPAAEGGTPFPAETLAWRRGFSVVQSAVIRPDVALDPTSLPGPLDAAAPGSVLLWDLTDGVALPTWAELDAAAALPELSAGALEVPTLLVRPGAPLPSGHEIAVLVTDAVRTADGRPWEGPAWARAALRGDPVDGVDAAAMADAAARAEAQGAPPAVLAFAFPVADATAPLRALTAGLRAPAAWSFSTVYDSDAGDPLGPRTWKRAQGTFTVPNYLAGDVAFVRGPDGAPTPQGTAEADLYVFIPASVRDAAPGSVPVWMFGHGIFANPASYFFDPDDPSGTIALADAAGVIVVGTVWRGLTTRDLPTPVAVGNDFGRFPELTDKLQQGVVQAAALAHLLADGALFDDPLFAGKANPAALRYHGISLGGIEGAVLFAHQDVLPHGVFHVGGSTWSTMLERSSNWSQFEPLVVAGVPSPADRQLLYAASPLFWDPVDPASYAADLAGRSVLWQEAIHDEQVPNLSTELLARAAGATLRGPAVTAPWGIPAGDVPGAGPALTQFDPEVAAPPAANRPAPTTGAHSIPRLWGGAAAQAARFLDPVDPGVVLHFCGDAPCTASNPGAPF
jgi:hypothetical protein